MRNSVRNQIMESMRAYASGSRKAWVTQWPAMVVLAVSAIFWSREVEEAIIGERSRGSGEAVTLHSTSFLVMIWKK